VYGCNGESPVQRNLSFASIGRKRWFQSRTPTEAFKVDSSGYVITTGNFYAGGLTNGIRINGNDYGNTFYQNASTIGGQPANIGFTLRDYNTFNFISC
jgi:hypothetical protein